MSTAQRGYATGLKSRKRVCAVCSAHASRMVIPSVSVSQRSRVIAFGVRKSQRPTYRERVRSNPPGTVRASGAKGHVLPFHRRPALPSIQAHRHEQDPNVGEHHIHRTHQEQSQEESLGKTTLLPLVGICGEEMRASWNRERPRGQSFRRNEEPPQSASAKTHPASG